MCVRVRRGCSCRANCVPAPDPNTTTPPLGSDEMGDAIIEEEGLEEIPDDPSGRVTRTPAATPTDEPEYCCLDVCQVRSGARSMPTTNDTNCRVQTFDCAHMRACVRACWLARSNKLVVLRAWCARTRVRRCEPVCVGPSACHRVMACLARGAKLLTTSSRAPAFSLCERPLLLSLARVRRS